MTRLIDADALCEEFKERQRAALRWKEKAILDGDEELQKSLYKEADNEPNDPEH